VATLTNAECRQHALDLLERSKGYAVNSPARTSTLAEAQVYATLALDAPPSEPTTVSVALPEGTFDPDLAVDLTPSARWTPEGAPLDPPATKPAPKRRTRKATPAKTDEGADK
jgi:hypothetical protein